MLPCRVAPPTESTMTSTPRPSVSRRASATKSSRDVVDALVEPELAQALQPIVARGRGQHTGARPLGHLDGGDADTAGTGMDQRGLPRLQAAELEEAVVGRAEGNGHAGGSVRRHAVGDLPGEALGRGPALGVRPVQPDGDGTVPHREAAHRRPDLGHRSRALVAHDVGHPGQVPAQPVERVTALDADRLDVDQDVARSDRPDRARPRSGRRRVFRVS